MADARGPDLVEHLRRGIGLHRIERVARKGIEKALRRRLEALRMQHIDGLDRLQPLDDLLDARKARQFDTRIHGDAFNDTAPLWGKRMTGSRQCGLGVDAKLSSPLVGEDAKSYV